MLCYIKLINFFYNIKPLNHYWMTVNMCSQEIFSLLNVDFSTGIIWNDVIQMDEVLQETSLSNHSLEVIHQSYWLQFKFEQ